MLFMMKGGLSSFNLVKFCSCWCRSLVNEVGLWWKWLSSLVVSMNSCCGWFSVFWLIIWCSSFSSVAWILLMILISFVL